MRKIIFMLSAFILSAVITNGQSTQEPPPPPKPQKDNSTKFKPPILSESGIQQNAFYKRNPAVANIEWKNSFNVIIILKNKKIENYNLESLQEKKMFIEKYGEVPLAPPPPPKMN